VAEGDGDVGAEVVGEQRGDLELLVGEGGAEDAADGDGVEPAVEAVEESADAVRVEG
jgi:hypothetical protein